MQHVCVEPDVPKVWCCDRGVTDMCDDVERGMECCARDLWYAGLEMGGWLG